jgi:hypothetical protein
MRRVFYLPTVSILSALALLCCSGAFGQNREKFVISAKAGGINAITGEASVHARGQTEWQQLMITDDLDAGDRVQTASDGRVEILLNPGSYLRVGGNSEIELADNSLANLEVRLLRGTAIVEATGGDGTQLLINISTPHARLAIVRQGLYRLNVIPGDGTELIVRKGRVILNDSHTKVKGGNKVIFSATNISVAKLTKEEKKSREEVELWSKNRAETLAKANRRISDRMLDSAFNSYRNPGFAVFGFRNSGLWFYNARAGCYTFLPFALGWGSPYGASYSTAVYAGFGSRGATIVRYPTNSWPSSNGSNTGATTGFPASSGTGVMSPAASTPSSGAIDSSARGRKIDMLHPIKN